MEGFFVELVYRPKDEKSFDEKMKRLTKMFDMEGKVWKSPVFYKEGKLMCCFNPLCKKYVYYLIISWDGRIVAEDRGGEVTLYMEDGSVKTLSGENWLSEIFLLDKLLESCV